MDRTRNPLAPGLLMPTPCNTCMISTVSSRPPIVRIKSVQTATLYGVAIGIRAITPVRRMPTCPRRQKATNFPVPIFRMLGSDPMYQYDTGIGTQYQSVISLEPVYPESGKNRNWVEYFLETIVKRPSLAFNYAQTAGQENSFTWSEMSEGLEMQFPLFDSLRAAGEIRVETLEETGRWFKDEFPLTPATAITTLRDVREEGNKSVWYNSRFYRSNLFWEENSFCFRDIHLFDENLQSQYLETPGTGNQFFSTIPYRLSIDSTGVLRKKMSDCA